MKKSLRDKAIGGQMSIALQLMKRKNHQAIATSEFKITMEQLVLLEVLKTNGDMNMTSLAKAVWKQNANITRIVDKLEKQKLVIRKPVKGDRRANLLSITPEGSILYKSVIPLVVKEQKKALLCLTEEEKEITLRSLKKIIDHLS